MSKYQNEREKERDLLKKDEAIETFKAILLDTIKINTPELWSWHEAKKVLKKDERFTLCKQLIDKEHKQELFDEHMKKFRAKQRDLFHQLLDEQQQQQQQHQQQYNNNLNLNDFSNLKIQSNEKSTSSSSSSSSLLHNQWKEIKKQIKLDQRYEKLHSDETFKMEKEFESYMNRKYDKAKENFLDLLKDTKLITFKTFEQINHNNNEQSSNQLKEIEDLLAKDASYTRLDSVPEIRKTILVDYIEKLYKDGPPPPPTATSSSINNK